MFINPSKFVYTLVILFLIHIINSNVEANIHSPSQGDSKHLESLIAVFDESKLLPTPVGTNGGGKVGVSVSIDGNMALIGGPDLAGDGAVIVVELINGNWVKTSLTQPLDGQSGDKFGVSVSLVGNKAVIGASRNNAGGLEVAGAAYIFDFDGTSWLQLAKLVASDANAFAGFGISIIFDGNRNIVI